MAQALWAHKHDCGTCRYWMGERTIAHDPRVVECAYGTKGLCTGPSRSCRGRQTYAGTHCGERCWEILPGMREW